MVDNDKQSIVWGHFSHMEVQETLARREVSNHKPDEEKVEKIEDNKLEKYEKKKKKYEKKKEKYEKKKEKYEKRKKNMRRKRREKKRKI